MLFDSFKAILKFLPPSNTFQVLLKVTLRMLMPQLYSSVHFRAFLLFSVNFLPHIIQTGLITHALNLQYIGIVRVRLAPRKE